MRPLQCIKRLVVFVFFIEVTSRPTPYGSRILNFLGSSIGASSSRSIVGCNSGKYCDNGRRHHNHNHQKNIGTGSDSSLVEISFQPLRELESVSSLTPFYPSLAGRKIFDENQLPHHQVVTVATPPNKARTPFNIISQRHHDFNRQRRTSYRRLLNDDDENNDNGSENDNGGGSGGRGGVGGSGDDFQSYHHRRYPDESSSSSIQRPTTPFTPVVGDLNGIPYPTEDPFGFMHRDTQYSIQNDKDLSLEDNDNSMGSNFPWDVFKGHQQALGSSLDSVSASGLKDSVPEEHSFMDSDSNNKRNALAAFKRQKFKSHQTQFIPSISGGAMTNLGDFFRNLKNNIEFMEKSRLSNSEEVLLEGDHPLQLFREELNSDGTKPTGTAAFLHAIRNYRPSQRIRSLVALNPEGYHGSQFLDPNYMWLGLGKR
ncbi:probable serine/threonine-protein kinase DDB_G0276461 [Eupeodes corollae]|uniref:probable serine/threonine-protein kinase DDB_G0276461 n=1 Tax=Eupeodes corollae TaxID=290404 RepID=UPI002490E97E|nr:probable serine/threonine-protein kinase DDB_G0276461 [Eupeodes corollae]